MLEKTRYKVGETYIFVKLNYKTKENKVKYFIPWIKDLSSIDFIALRCKNHQMVNWENEPEHKEKKYNGFIFEVIKSSAIDIKTGSIWHSQYPKAFYCETEDLLYRADDSLIASKNFETIPLLRDVKTVLKGIYSGIYEPRFNSRDNGFTLSSLRTKFKFIKDILLKEYGLDVVIVKKLIRTAKRSDPPMEFKTPVIVRTENCNI